VNRYVRHSTPQAPTQAPMVIEAPQQPMMMAAQPQQQQPPSMEAILPWLLMSLMEQMKAPEGESSGGSLPAEKSSPALNKFQKMPSAPKALSGLPSTTGAKTFTKSVSKEPGSPKPTGQFASPAKAPSHAVAKSQAPEALANPPVTPAGVAPVSRSADVRHEDQAVSRAVDNSARRYVKRTGLVNTANRTYQKSLEPKLSIKR
jgi:hypothetical protein